MEKVSSELINYLLGVDLPKLSRVFKEREVSGGSLESPLAIRLDGVRFGKALRDFRKPRDRIVHEALVEAAKIIMSRFNALVAYVCSDEINVILHNELPYGGRFFKIVSVTASIASTHTSLKLGKPLYFDSRIIKLGSINEAYTYLTYRARVCMNNFISALYHELTKLKETPPTRDMLMYIKERNVLDKLNTWEVLGTCLAWREIVKKGYNPLIRVHVYTRRRVISEVSVNECVRVRA